MSYIHLLVVRRHFYWIRYESTWSAFIRGINAT